MSLVHVTLLWARIARARMPLTAPRFVGYCDSGPTGVLLISRLFAVLGRTTHVVDARLPSLFAHVPERCVRRELRNRFRQIFVERIAALLLDLTGLRRRFIAVPIVQARFFHCLTSSPKLSREANICSIVADTAALSQGADSRSRSSRANVHAPEPHEWPVGHLGAVGSRAA